MSVTRRLLLAAGGGSFTLPVATYSVSTITSPNEGGWVWFVAPKAIQDGSDTYVGYVRDGGDVRAATVDSASRTVTSTAMVYDNFLDDDHEPPSFVVRPDGYIMVALAYHVGEIYAGIGTAPGVMPTQFQLTNITSSVGSLSGAAGYSYASILYLPDESRYYIFARYHDASSVPYVVYTYSDDDGATWAARTAVQQITYHHAAVNGTGRIDLALSDHPNFGQGDNPAVKTSIYHAYYEAGTGWHKSDGTNLTPLIGNTAATLVYDGTTERGWMFDVAIDGSGNPVIAFVVYTDPFPTGAKRYGYARWSGSAWVVNDNVADAGNTFPTGSAGGSDEYVGGIAIDPDDVNRILYSSDAATGHFQVYLATTADGGATWSSEALTSDTDKNVRPVWVRDHTSDLQAVWLYGTYTDYFDYQQGIKGFGSP